MDYSSVSIPPARDRVLADAFSARSNSFGFLRWSMATLVIVGHAYPLGGFGGGVDPLYSWSAGQESFGGMAVAGFFIISGFLITRSWSRSKSVSRFLWHRFLRIFPAFWTCIGVTAFVFAPLAWWRERGDLRGFVTEPERNSVGYLTHNFLLSINQPDIGDLLMGTPYGSTAVPAWNGSLWTLSYEFGCYLMIATLGVAGLLSRNRGLIAALTGLTYLVVLSTHVQPALAPQLVPIFADVWIARFMFLFLLGSLFSLYADRIHLNGRLCVLALAVGAASLNSGGWAALGYPALAYLLIWTAVRLPFPAFDRPGDFSYGIYIYAFPIQMLLADFGLVRYGLAVYILLGWALTTIAAVLSWHLVEKRALGLKSWTPSRPQVMRRRAARRSQSGRAEAAPPPSGPLAMADAPAEKQPG